MILSSIAALCPQSPEWEQRREQFSQAQSLPALVLAAMQVGLLLARILLEEELNERSQQPQQWPDCPQCRRRMRSKGFRPRQMHTVVGVIG